jgi:hypothetical protein
MAEVPAPATVSPSRYPGSETPRGPGFHRDSGAATGETPGLKSLARLVLARDRCRDTERDRASRRVMGGGTVAETPYFPTTTSNHPEHQIVSDVSLSRGLASETPETLREEPASVATEGAQGCAAEVIPELTSSRSEIREERVAIVEHNGGIPRAWAEEFARLDPARLPSDVPAKRWLRFVDDVGAFLDSPFCAVAAALGWGPLDLFGCDRDRPFARIDQAGLLWLLNGDKLIALTQNTATIERRTGARQTYRRKPAAPGRVPASELR